MNEVTKCEIPTVADIVKLIEAGLYKTNAHDFISDILECGAIAIANSIKKTQIREETYFKIINKYDKEQQNLIVEIFSKIYILLSNQINSDVGFNDYLGEIYMQSQISNNKTGQFFTPFHISKLTAGVEMDTKTVKEYMEQNRILKIFEPSCGSGGMILACADILYNKYGFNISRNLFVECGDIDRRCVCMAYLQLSLAGIPAIVYHRDGLTLQTWDKWETPAYLMQYLRFKNCKKERLKC